MEYKVSELDEYKVCKVLRDYAAKKAEKSFKSGRSEGRVEALLDLVNKGAITLDYAIENSGLPKEEFLSIAKSLGYNI